MSPAPPAIPQNEANLIASLKALVSDVQKTAPGGARSGIQVLNAKEPPFRAKGDGSIETTTLQAAFNAAADAHIPLYLPAGTYRGAISVDSRAGWAIIGDTFGSFGNPATELIAPDNSTTALDVFSNAGSGGVAEFHIENLKVTGGGASTQNCGVRIWNALHFGLRNLAVNGGTGLSVQGSGHFVLDNIEYYGTIPLSIGNGNTNLTPYDGVLTNSGPGVILAGQAYQQGGSQAAVVLGGRLLAVAFIGTQFRASGFSGDPGAPAGPEAVVDINGNSTGLVDGSVTFISCHAESCYNEAGTTAVYRIGHVNKFGQVSISAGNYWGQGIDAVRMCRDWLRSVRCRSLLVSGSVANGQGAPGFSRSMIRFDNTPDQYTFTNLVFDSTTGALYSDAAGILTGTLGDASNLGPLLGGQYDAAQLPTASESRAGQRALVKDANSTQFFSAVAGGGENVVPVVCDGATWRIG